MTVNVSSEVRTSGLASLPRVANDADFPSGYQPVARAGQGAYTETWKVQNLQTGEFFALKKPKKDLHGLKTVLTLLRNEANVARIAASDYIVGFHDAIDSETDPCTISQWLTGTTLEAILQKQKFLPIESSLWIARQCALGLLDLQQAGFIHGDVKPANIFVLNSGKVKLIDLGFARPIDQIESPKTVSGTPEYMPPEVLSQENHSILHRDMYSLGVTLFRMLAGRLPFEADSVSEILELHRQSRPPQLRKFCPHAPRELAEFTERLLSKHPLRRPENLRELAHQLIQFELASWPID